MLAIKDIHTKFTLQRRRMESAILDRIVHFDKRSETLSRFKALDISKLLTKSFLCLQNFPDSFCVEWTSSDHKPHPSCLDLSYFTLFCNSSHYTQMLGRHGVLDLSSASGHIAESPAQTAHLVPECLYCICSMIIITVHNYFICQ